MRVAEVQEDGQGLIAEAEHLRDAQEKINDIRQIAASFKCVDADKYNELQNVVLSKLSGLIREQKDVRSIDNHITAIGYSTRMNSGHIKELNDAIYTDIISGYLELLSAASDGNITSRVNRLDCLINRDVAEYSMLVRATCSKVADEIGVRPGETLFNIESID